MGGSPSKRRQNVVVLDGLDEVSGEWDRDHHMFRFLESLLDYDNLIITSRPSGILPTGLRSIDLELETIGFYPAQVEAYLNADPKMKPKAKEVQYFLQKHHLVQGLVRIPIQLDALCYTWDDVGSEVPDTMTSIYQAIEQRLWKKDFERGIKRNGQLVKRSHIELDHVRNLVPEELELLEVLAFTGLYNHIIDFTPKQRAAIYERSTSWAKTSLSDDTLLCLSFIRTSDKDGIRNFHFIHLTFQEYFAARHFKRLWTTDRKLDCINLSSRLMEVKQIHPIELLQEHKYTARYDIFWRFVAGLLDAESRASTLFEKIEEEPLDLLGPAHQRLVMHCLSETASQPSDIENRRILEAHLSKWLLFECEYYGQANLAVEAECPDHVLEVAWREASAYLQIKLMERLYTRITVPDSIMQQAVSWFAKGEERSLIAEIFLRRRLTLPDEIVRAVAARLNDQERAVRFSALRVLSRQTALPDKICYAVAARLEDRDSYVRKQAVKALYRRATLPDKILHALAARLEDEDEGIRWDAVDALGRREALPDDILQAVAARLVDDEHCHIRVAAVEVLGQPEALPDGILQAVAGLLEDEDERVRDAAVRFWGRRELLPDDILRAVAGRFEDDEHWEVRMAAVEVLGRREALPDGILRAAAARLEDEDAAVRKAAVQALGRREALPDDILRALAERIKDGAPTVCAAAISAPNQRALRDEHLQTIAARLEDEDASVRKSATGTLSQIGCESELPDEILLALAPRLEDQEHNVRRIAAQTLHIQAKARVFPDKIIRALAGRLDDDPDVCRHAIGAFKGQATLPDDILWALAARLEGPDCWVWHDAAEALDQQAALPEEIPRTMVPRLRYTKSFRSPHDCMVILSLLQRGGQFCRKFLTDPSGAYQFYRSLLHLSFEEQLSWYIKDGKSYVNTREKIWAEAVDGDEHEAIAFIREEYCPWLWDEDYMYN